jgi:hydroxymethylpyrimidine pyrophosphatase-like HAD family hydrolase
MRKHPYLNHATCVARLHEWYKRNGRLIVAYDFDNTVYDYHSKGHDYSEVIELLRRAKKAGCYLIVFTGNENKDFVIRYLAENDIPYDLINEHAPFTPSKARKIYANILLDDAAGLESAFHQLEDFLNHENL